MHRLRHSVRQARRVTALQVGQRHPTWHPVLATPPPLPAPSCCSAAASCATRRGWSSDKDAAAADAAAAAGAVPTRDASPEHRRPRKELYMVFTCGRCNTRAVKGFSRQAYEHGVVMVDCPGCKARHLVADRKGWFGTPGSVEDFLAEKREVIIKRGGAGEDALEITEDELLGWARRGKDDGASGG